MMTLDSAEEEERYLPVIGCQYDLVCRDCPDHTRHDDFGVPESRSAEFFVLVSESETIRFLVYPAQHT